MKLYIGNLHYDITQAQLLTLFSQAGDVSTVYLAHDRYTSKSSGFAFVTMVTDEEGQKAISLFHGHLLRDRPMTVAEMAPPTEEGWRGAAGTVIYRKPPQPAGKDTADDSHKN
ncbi:MAG: RNA-binding protein [Anaerolineae bacterium]|nr:RNA-binding protein [Anaerolineae bacterium]